MTHAEQRLMNSLPNEARAVVKAAVQVRLRALDQLFFMREDGVLTQEQAAAARRLLNDVGTHTEENSP